MIMMIPSRLLMKIKHFKDKLPLMGLRKKRKISHLRYIRWIHKMLTVDIKFKKCMTCSIILTLIVATLNLKILLILSL